LPGAAAPNRLAGVSGADPHPELPDSVRLDAAAALAGELAGDVGRLVEFLAVRLAGALPGAVDVKRQGLLGRGTVEGVRVVAGDEHYELAIGRASAVQTTVGQAVHGVVLRRDPVPIGEWTRRLLTRLETLAAQSSETAAALEGLI
jgi:hypothetical protein